MRARRGLIGILILLLLLGGTQYALQRYASAELDTALSQWRDWTDVRVGTRHFWLWGTADLDQISITPSARVGAMYGLPLGYSATIDRLHLHRLRLGWSDGLVLTSADIDVHGVHLPLPDWGWSIAVAHDAQGRRLQAPTLRSLGLKELEFTASLRLQFPQGYSYPQLSAWSAVPSVAHIDLECSLYAPAGASHNLGRIELRHCLLDYQDLGLVQRFELEMARSNDMELPALQNTLSAQIGLDAERSHWALLNMQALQRFVRRPLQTLRLQIAPPQALPLEKIPRGIWPGLPALLGLTAELPSSQN